MKWPVVGRLLSSRWCLGALAVIAGALGFTLLSWLFTPSDAAADPLLPPVSVPTISVPGVATVTAGTPAQPSVDVSSALAEVSVHSQPQPAPAEPPRVSVRAVLGTVRSVSETVHRLPVAAVVAAPLHDLTTLVDSVAGTVAPETAAGVVAAPAVNHRVCSPARHNVGSPRAAPIHLVSAAPPTRTIPASTRQQKPASKHGPAFPAPIPLNSSCVSGGHGGAPTAAFLAAAHPTGPLVGPVLFVADQVGADDNAARPGVTPD